MGYDFFIYIIYIEIIAGMARNRSMQRTRNRRRNRSKRGGNTAEELFQQAEEADGKRDYVEAEQLYRRAAALEHPEANFKLGTIIYTGQGPWENEPESVLFPEALKFFNLAVKQGKEEDDWMEEATGIVEHITNKLAKEGAAAPAGGKSRRRRHSRRHHRHRTNKKSRKGRKSRRSGGCR